MKYKLLRFSLMCVLAMLFGTVYAAEVTMKYSGTTTEKMTGDNDAALFGLDATEWSVVGDSAKAKDALYPGLNKDGDFRLYFDSRGDCTITVTSLRGATINSISMTFTSTDYDNVKVTVDGSAVKAVNGVWPINSTSFVLGNGNTTSVQVQIKELTINYEADSRESTTLTIGDHQTTGEIGGSMSLPTATVMAGTTVLADVAIDWESSNTDVATIADGIISFKGAGTAPITASFGGNDNYRPSSASFALNILKHETSIVFGEGYATSGLARKSLDLPTFTVMSGDNVISDATVTWSSSQESVAKIVDDKLNLIDEGTADITCTYAGDNVYAASTATYQVEVSENVEIANPYTYIFNEKVYNAKEETKKLNGAKWTLAMTCSDAEGFFGYDAAKGQQFGSGKKPATALTLTTSDIKGTITSVRINTCGASDIAGTVGVTVGETALKSGDKTTASLTSSATDYEFTGSASGDITISYAQTSSKAIYIKSIEVEFTTVTEPAEFQDFAAIVNNQTGTLLTSEEQVQGTAVEFGIAVDADGNTTRVATDDASSIATISGSYHGEHGMTGLKVVTAVPGAVKILVGKCTYSGNTITVTNSAGEKVIEYTPQGEQGSGDLVCWKNDRNNVIELIYNGEATTLTITGMDYCPFVAVQRTEVTPVEEWAWQDFGIDLVNDLTSEQRVNGTAYELGFVVAADGTKTQVAADAANANIILKGTYHNDHGWTNTKATVKVNGPVQIDLGNCYYGSGTATVKDANDATVATTSLVDKKTCWGQDHSSFVSMKYTGEATVLTIEYSSYLPYIAVKAIEATSVDVAYSKGDMECDGDLLPAGGSFAAGDEYTIPTNTTLYRDGYTLTAWSDGNNEYAVGSTITLADNLSLTPVFTQNTVTLADRTEPVTLKWNFRKDQGAPVLNYQNKDGFLVTQATIGSSLIDVKMPFTTNNGGKLNNQNNNDCAQCNNNTTFTIPSCKDAVVTMEAYGGDYIFKADGKTPTTVDGQSDYTAGQTLSYTIAGTAQTVDIVMGNDAGYVRFVQVVLPVVQSQGGGQTFVNEDATITWAMGVTEANVTADAAPEGAFSLTSISHGSKLDNTSKGDGVTTYDGVTYTDYQPKETANGTSGFEVVWNVKPATGITFTLTGVSAGNYRNGTNGGNIKYVIRKKDGTETELGTIIPGRNTANGANPNYTFAKSGLNQELSDEFALVAYIGGDLANNKQIGFANVKIEGKVNGTAVAVNKYTLATAATPAEGGSVSAYPAADEYEEGSTVKLTATENFGYDFVNWTNADDEVVSTDAVYTFDIAKDETLTANFQAVETYKLALTVDGTNDYMVTIDPAPTMVDGKMMYEAGTAVQLTANSYEGLVTFNNWSDGDTKSEKLFSITDDTQLTAIFENAVDIIAGWDFYKSGNNGRAADFASDGNETAALSLVETGTTNTSGWLDKSTEAANGYESFKGAAVNWKVGSGNGDVGHYHWQTKVNAENFTNIKVQFQMLYNYNAYQTYNAEYSLDGETWTGFGSITMTAAKAPASFNEALPAACNNKKNIFIRMIADKDSSVDGTESANDGNALAMFFITGTEKLVDDGNAPELVSTVPVDNGTGVSASGKVVLTFDEKVKLAEGTTAYINDTKINSETQIAVSGAVSGKSISFEYKGLEYTTEYSFVLPANSVSDLTDNTLESPVRLTFTTMTRPTVTKGLYDEVVDNVEQLVAAIGKAEARSDKNVRYRIFLKNGTYQLPQGTADVTHNVELKDGSSQQIVTKDVITYIKSGNISLIGESRDGVIITNTIPANETFEGKYGTASVYEGIGSSDVLQVSGSGLYFQDLTISTGMADGRGRDIALNDKGTQNVFKNVCLHGYQDTWKSGKGLYYFEDGVIRGRTDFLCGGGDAFFNQVDIVMCEKGGYVVAPQGNSHYGYVFKDCTLKGEAGDVSGNYNLGRAWTAEAETYFINTTMEALPNAKGWAEWNNGPKRFAEFNSKTATGTDVDLSSRAKTINGTPNVPVLTAEEAIEIGDLHNSFGDWDPTLATEQAPVPQNVKQEGNNLVWDNSNYALLWAIVKDGSVVGFTTEPTCELTESGTYAVRAANEMGGLSEVSESVEVVKVTLNASGYATLASDKALDFSAVEGLTAYIVKEQTADKAILTSVTATPAETGLVLKGEAGAEYTIPVATSATSIEGNLLQAAVTATTVDTKSVVYVLDGNKFKVFTGTEIPAGKAYLPKSGVGARLLELVFDDATGIATVPVDIPVDVPVYDLQGRRVKTPSKGIYVVDGKKVIIK